MKNLFILFLLTYSLQSSQLKPLEYVNVQKFSGLWYEIARTYNYYQRRCVGSSVEYILTPEQEYDVYNRCFDTTLDGKLIEYNGSAKGAKEKENVSTLDMTYFWIFTKHYYVYFFADDFNTAVVADDKLDNLWIMSRTPQISKQKLQNILALLKDNMDLKRLIYTPQDKQGRYK